MIKKIRNRIEAGQMLAKKLQHFASQDGVLVLALPRGGVPVGYEIAKALKLPLDIFLVRKLGVPGQEELALGAIATGNVIVFNEEIVQSLALNQIDINEIIAKEQRVLTERNLKYRGNQNPPDIKNRTVILVDDGIATGATIRAALKAIRKLGSLNIIIAVPVAPPDVLNQFSQLADQLICLATPSPFFAIGNWYEDFSQTSDEEVITLLEKAKRERD